MHLIAPLAVGFADAPSGSALIYSHGTTTAAGVFEDFDGEEGVSSHPLDSHGRVIRYVDEMVDVTILDSNGATVLTFVAGVEAASVAVRNNMFTGTETDGSTALGGLTDLQTVIDSLHASFGSTDGNVDVNGASNTLQGALASMDASIFKNIVAFGADPTGATVSTSEIQAALDSAAVSGGAVYVPSGTFHIDSLVSVPAGVSVIGSGHDAIITCKTTSFSTIGSLLYLEGNNYITGLHIQPNDTADAALEIASAVEDVTVRDCKFSIYSGTSIATSGIMLRGATAPSEILIIACEFLNIRYGINHYSGPDVQSVAVIGCNFVNAQAVGSFLYSACAFQNNENPSTYTRCIAPNASSVGDMVVSGCVFDGRTNYYAMSLATSSGFVAAISGNAFHGILPVCSTQGACAGIIRFPDRDERRTTFTSATYSADTGYGVHVGTVSAAGNEIYANPTAFAYNGAKLEIHYKNTNSTQRQQTWTSATAYKGGVEAVNVVQNNKVVSTFRYDSGTWFLVSNTASYAA